MNEISIIDELKQWLEQKGNTPLKLAYNLGYRSSNTVNMWLRREHIPEWQIGRVRKALRKKGIKDE